MEEVMIQIKQNLEKIALRVVTLEEWDFPGLNEILGTLSIIGALSKNIDNKVFSDVIEGLSNYIEKLLINEQNDFCPLEEGITILQSIWRCVNFNEEYKTDIKSFLNKLGFNRNNEKEIEKELPIIKKSEIQPKEQINNEEQQENEIQILSDFVLESLENLEIIEVSLIELEQDPNDRDTVNAIFRAFHTIKGVSGFLNLNQINDISHGIENLLDNVRQEEFFITTEIIDLILESVDILKRLVRWIENSLASGMPITQDNESAVPLLKKIESLLSKYKNPESNKLLGEILLEKGVIKKEDLEYSLKVQKGSPDKRLGRILIDERKIGSKNIISALRDQKKSNKFIDSQVKVDIAKLDNLVDQTGELVIAQAMLRQNNLIRSLNDQKLSQNLNQLTQIISILQKIALSMRMVPIRSTFQKMVRLVRDLAHSSEKDISLEMIGDDTEIDRNVVDKLYEPLVHMIRNAVDHGLEPTEERIKLGKNKKGLIRLRAYHKGGNIIIEIEDDGKGLDKERILQKAKSNNIIQSDSSLTEAEIYNLIFLPGFSTAEKVTDISGRGVGMDIVKRTIENLRGHLDIKSQFGKGSAVIISLPLTLAIIDGMLVRVGLERYILPTLAILESFKPQKKDYYTIEGKGEMILVRGKIIPLIRIDLLFGIKGDANYPWDGLVVVVENKGEQRGLLLDELLGKEEIVIKSLGEALKDIKGLSGGAILGDGKVGLILDIAGIFEISHNRK